MRIKPENVFHPLISRCAINFVDSNLSCVLKVANGRISRPALRRVKELVLIVCV
jgi:hypothetical protein